MYDLKFQFGEFILEDAMYLNDIKDVVEIQFDLSSRYGTRVIIGFYNNYPCLLERVYPRSYVVTWLNTTPSNAYNSGILNRVINPKTAEINLELSVANKWLDSITDKDIIEAKKIIRMIDDEYAGPFINIVLASHMSKKIGLKQDMFIDYGDAHK